MVSTFFAIRANALATEAIRDGTAPIENHRSRAGKGARRRAEQPRRFENEIVLIKRQRMQSRP